MYSIAIEIPSSNQLDDAMMFLCSHYRDWGSIVHNWQGSTYFMWFDLLASRPVDKLHRFGFTLNRQAQCIDPSEVMYLRTLCSWMASKVGVRGENLSPYTLQADTRRSSEEPVSTTMESNLERLGDFSGRTQRLHLALIEGEMLMLDEKWSEMFGPEIALRKTA